MKGSLQKGLKRSFPKPDDICENFAKANLLDRSSPSTHKPILGLRIKRRPYRSNHCSTKVKSWLTVALLTYNRSDNCCNVNTRSSSSSICKRLILRWKGSANVVSGLASWAWSRWCNMASRSSLVARSATPIPGCLIISVPKKIATNDPIVSNRFERFFRIRSAFRPIFQW